MARSVAIVLDEAYGELEKLAFRTPVWIVDTRANRAAAEAVLRAAIDWPHITVTLFAPQEWPALLALIELQQHFDAAEVIGARLSVAARGAFWERGFAHVDETAHGFRARKR